jgi:ASCH domain-containing protein
MKALTLWQPWAWLVVHGYKDVENRGWMTSYRGPLLIHAGRKVDPEYEAIAERALREFGIRIPSREELPQGVICGEVRVTDCVRAHPSPWFTGPCAFVLADALLLDPIPLRGMPGLYEVPERLRPIAPAEARPAGSSQRRKLP